MSETSTPTVERIVTSRFWSTQNPWYWNDNYNPFNIVGDGVEALCLLHQRRDSNPDDREILMELSKCHETIGDPVGAEFYRWMHNHDRTCDNYRGFWWFDNNLLKPTESRFVIPVAAVWLMENGHVREPLPVAVDGEESATEFGFVTSVNVGESIRELGFDGRLTAETTLLAAWRLMTDLERLKAMAWDYEFLDPTREKKDSEAP